MTLKLGLIGYPLGHSASPWIHENFMKKIAETGTYEKFTIEPGPDFGERIATLKSANLDGFNVTVPHKETIIPYLDELSEDAKNMGAVNTVAQVNGKWIGYNTDGSGYVRSLENAYPELTTDKEQKIIILGAGGAARGIYYALMKAGYHTIDLANRTVSTAKEIATLNDGKVHTRIKTLEEAEATIGEYDVIIQTTSVGMEPNVQASIISLKHLKEKTIVSDIVYKPLDTKFLTEAKTYNGRIHYGHAMLLYQALYAFEIWSGKEVPIENMDEALKAYVQRSN
ncbi:MAG TPA: shikimate dehydrogenase [Candidatus Avamphibacillus intestinigallinarum]|nr:shikimate dehydrogenase [Candidatus Avamphibacillus intestinigallinarum]